MKFPFVKFQLFTISFLFFSFLSAQKAAQKGEFQDVEVKSFKAPFSELVINAFGVDLPITIGDKTKFKGLKNKKIDPKEITEGLIIHKLEYELTGETYLATSIETEISADGSIVVNGLFEGFLDDFAIVDGHPIRLSDGVNIEGRKVKKCACKGLLAPSFKSPFIKPGGFYVTIEGKKDDQGVINAEKVKLCRNVFGKPERELLTSIDDNLTNGTNPLSNIPQDIVDLNMQLYDGKIRVGKYSYQLTDDIGLQGYINKIGHRLLPKRAKEKQMEQGAVYYRFYVIDDPVPNAFAFPNGMIFIHTGLLDIIENEAQLAVVLGHEIAHVTHEHGKERYETNILVKGAGDLFDALWSKSLQEKAIKMAPELSPEMALSVSKVTSSITPAAISNIIQPQPQMESQADRVGLFYAYQAGYDIREATKFWNKMSELTGEQSFQVKIKNDFFNSLKSDRFSNRDQSLFEKLPMVGADVIANQVLNTIYTSHPKAKKTCAGD